MYTDLKLWEDRGILRNLPQLKPYPIQLLKKLLSDVQQKGNADDAARAAEYFSDMDGIVNVTGLRRRDPHRPEKRLRCVHLRRSFPGFAGSQRDVSGYLAGVANNGPGDSLLPEYMRNPTDYIYDSGVKPLGTTALIPRVSSASAGALGSDTFYFQGGDIRGSWGPFWGENVVSSPYFAADGPVLLRLPGRELHRDQSIMTLSARTSDGTGGPFPNKFLALHDYSSTRCPGSPWASSSRSSRRKVRASLPAAICDALLYTGICGIPRQFSYRAQRQHQAAGGGPRGLPRLF